MNHADHRPARRAVRGLAVAALALGAPARAQSLFLQPARVQDAPGVESQPAFEPAAVSLLWVAEPEKHVYQKHDIITIVIDETSSQSSSQSLETQQKSDNSATINSMLHYMALLELRLQQGDTSGLDLIDFTGDRKFTGDGDYQRKDKFTARITATVLEVKPNGNLVLQATKRITKDDEDQTLVLSGVVREDDITRQNTVLSSQMADLNIVMENAGEVRDAAKKGLITEIFDAIFSF